VFPNAKLMPSLRLFPTSICAVSYINGVLTRRPKQRINFGRGVVQAVAILWKPRRTGGTFMIQTVKQASAWIDSLRPACAAMKEV
jgi:hypothetical protein